MTRRAKGRAGETVELASGQMPQRVAGERIEREQTPVPEPDERVDADAEFVRPQAGRKGESCKRILPEKNQKQDRQIQEIAMDVLQDERKRGFPLVVAGSAFTDCASRRIQEKCPIVGLSVVIAGGAETERAGEDQQCRR